MSEMENSGISEAEYVQGLGDRVRPQTLETGLNYIFRMLVPSHQRPPYAVEIFSSLIEMQREDHPAWQYLLTLEHDRPKGRVKAPLSTDGLVITPNPGNDPELHGDFVAIGYLLGSTAVSDSELIQLVAEELVDNRGGNL